jgi:hypothetical protein
MKYLIIIFLVMAVGCTSVGIKTVHAPDLDLASYETYNYLAFNYVRYDSLPLNENVYNYFIQQMNSHLLAKGFELSEDPNLLLNIGVVVRQEQEILEPDTRKYMGQELYSREERVIGVYDIGDVHIDFLDNQKNTLVWQASIETVFSENEHKMKNKIDKSVAKLFESIPSR